MKNSKRFLALVLMVVMMFSVMAIGASAADPNIKDTSFSFTVTGSAYTSTTVRAKNDTSTVYLFLNDSSTYIHCYAQACGSTTYTSGLYNKTLVNAERVTNVVCRRGVQYSIHSDIYEEGYRYAALRFKQLVTPNSGTVAGVWSPDSSGSYTDAT